ncbi:hypothetical protein TIFTF001_052356, partial [Ficus carica]
MARRSFATMPFLATVIADEKSLEFAKRFWSDEVTRDFSPVSAKMLRSLVDAIMGASYRICGAPYRPKSKRWKRHYLCMLSPSGVFPLPLKLWLAFPDFGVLTADCMFERLMKDGWSPVAESLTSLRSDPSSMGHVES